MSLPPPVRIGVVGCGWIARTIHLPLLARLPGVSVVALVEAEPERLEEAGRLAPAARRFHEFREALSLPDVDAVLVSLPTHLHASAAAAVLQSGRHLYLEKPLATNVEEGRELVLEARRAGTVGMIGFNYRFHPLLQALRRHVRDSGPGEWLAVRTVFTSPGRILPPWKRARATGGGVLLDLASHHVDLLRFLFGREVRRVACDLRSVETEADTALLHVTLEGGPPAQVLCSLCAPDEDRIEVYGRREVLTVDRYRSWTVERRSAASGGPRAVGWGRRLAERLRSPVLWQRLRGSGSEPSYATALAEFVGAIRDGRPPRPDLEDGLRCLEVLAAAEASARADDPVEVRNSVPATAGASG